MDIEGLDDIRHRLHAEYEEKLRKVCVEYIKSNNTIKVGDILKTHAGYGEVLAIAFYRYYRLEGEPTCTYRCNALTKKKEPVKRGPTEIFVYPCTIKEVNGKPV